MLHQVLIALWPCSTPQGNESSFSSKRKTRYRIPNLFAYIIWSIEEVLDHLSCIATCRVVLCVRDMPNQGNDFIEDWQGVYYAIQYIISIYSYVVKNWTRSLQGLTPDFPVLGLCRRLSVSCRGPSSIANPFQLPAASYAAPLPTFLASAARH